MSISKKVARNDHSTSCEGHSYKSCAGENILKLTVPFLFLMMIVSVVVLDSKSSAIPPVDKPTLFPSDKATKSVNKPRKTLTFVHSLPTSINASKPGHDVAHNGDIVQYRCSCSTKVEIRKGLSLSMPTPECDPYVQESEGEDVTEGKNTMRWSNQNVSVLFRLKGFFPNSLGLLNKTNNGPFTLKEKYLIIK